jgi:ankyrin repeat protein
MKKMLSLVIFSLSTLLVSAEMPDINQQLYDAADALDIELASALLDSGANPNWAKVSRNETRSIMSNIMHDLFDGDIAQKKVAEMASLLLKRGATLTTNDNGILYFPICTGAYDVTKLLINHGADVCKFPLPNNVGVDITPTEVASENSHFDILNLLISNGAEPPNEKDTIQSRFIQMASELNAIPEMKDLLKQGALVNGKNRQGETALVKALSSLAARDPSIVFFLLDSGADASLHGEGNHWGKFPLHIATYYTSLALKSRTSTPNDIENCVAILQRLIDAGADEHISKRNERGQTPLHIAANYNNLPAAEVLLKNNAKVMLKDDTGRTPLDYAESGKMIGLLKQFGAKERW